MAQRTTSLAADFILHFSNPAMGGRSVSSGASRGLEPGGNATNGIAVAPENRMTASVTGEVIDMSCYFDDGASGPEHAACARKCIASGLPVRLKGTDGKIYLLIGQQEPPSPPVAPKRESLNVQLALYAAKVVTVRGTIIRKQGVNVIEDARVISS